MYVPKAVLKVEAYSKPARKGFETVALAIL
jgi:hypothetical protein